MHGCGAWTVDAVPVWVSAVEYNLVDKNVSGIVTRGKIIK